MPTVVLLPWCRVDKELKVDTIEILPFERRGRSGPHVPRTQRAITNQISKLMTPYRDLKGRRIDNAAVVKWMDKSVIEDLTEEEIATTKELLDLVTFSALSSRDLFSSGGNYCNSDTFTHYVQKFRPPTDFIAIETARARGAGQALSGWSIASLRIGIPAHVSTNSTVEVDENLLAGLLSFRRQTSEKTWNRWLDAIGSFNLANTDSDNVSYASEWTLMCGAFQQILGAKGTAEDVAAKFTAILNSEPKILAAKSHRKSQSFNRKTQLPLRQEWMREFYRIRGNLAHGWLTPNQPHAWTVGEHLTLSRLAFPLVVKELLRQQNAHNLTDLDEVWIENFESFANRKLVTERKLIAQEVRKMVGERVSSRAEADFKRKFTEGLDEYSDNSRAADNISH